MKENPVRAFFYSRILSNYLCLCLRTIKLCVVISKISRPISSEVRVDRTNKTKTGSEKCVENLHNDSSCLSQAHMISSVKVAELDARPIVFIMTPIA